MNLGCQIFSLNEEVREFIVDIIGRQLLLCCGYHFQSHLLASFSFTISFFFLLALSDKFIGNNKHCEQSRSNGKKKRKRKYNE